MVGNNTYGVVRPSLINPSSDVEIWYHYRPTRNSVDKDFDSYKEITDVASVLSNANHNTEKDDKRLPGMYHLNLPVSIFAKKGIYTLLIRPKEYHFQIKDVGALAAYPDIKGIVIDLNSVPDASMFANDNLVGYRVEYYDNDGNGLKRQEYYRIITSNNACEPISQNLTSANTNANGYRFNNSGTLCFITVTPSTSPSFKSNVTPYIGSPNQEIVITNTKFDPVSIEIEMVEHDIETLSTMIEGEQIRNKENGRLSIYNDNGEIYKQYEFVTVKDNYNSQNILEAKLNKKDNIDFSADLEEIKEVNANN